MKFARYLYYSVRGIPHLGIAGALKLIMARYIKRQFRIRPRGYPAAITIRGATSDASILCNIIVCQEYSIPHLTNVKSIIDAGANIGMAAIYFSNRFPEARITSIEPESSNFDLLVKNTSHLPNVFAIHAALWPTRTALSVVDSNSEKWGFQYVPAKNPNQTHVRGITIRDLLEDADENEVDLLKIDIEGGEKEVFSGDCDWLKKCRYLLLEVHPGCWKNVFHAFEKIDFECGITGENLFFQINK